MDGVAQSDFLMGNPLESPSSFTSATRIFGVKWRNWKLLLKEIDEDSYAIRNMAYPSIYNLLVDPKEEVPELNYLNDTWVDFPCIRF